MTSSTTPAARRFWQECERHHDLAKRFERNVELTHPGALTGRTSGCPSPHRCTWCATAVTYYEYRGPRI